MVRVFDVAAFIAQRIEAMQPMKLQKLVYYAQAWSLVRDDAALFPESFQAWTYGPVCPPLYAKHAGQARIPVPLPYGDVSKLDDKQQSTVLAVLNAYGDKSSIWLSDLTHREDPWRRARVGVELDAPSSNEITLESMQTYYAEAESIERRQVLQFGVTGNTVIECLKNLSDDDAAIVDELSAFDEDPEVAKLSLP